MKAHSTVYTTTKLIDRLTYKLDNNQIPLNQYIDLSKAFDMIVLITAYFFLNFTLHYYGIRNTALTLQKSYFTIRKQYGDYKDTNSNMMLIHKSHRKVQ